MQFHSYSSRRERRWFFFPEYVLFLLTNGNELSTFVHLHQHFNILPCSLKKHLHVLKVLNCISFQWQNLEHFRSKHCPYFYVSFMQSMFKGLYHTYFEYYYFSLSRDYAIFFSDQNEKKHLWKFTKLDSLYKSVFMHLLCLGEAVTFISNK